MAQRCPLKRLFDFSLASLGLLVLAPFFLGVVGAILVFEGGPVFFRQERVGWKGRPFKIWKFRTMSVDAERQGLQLTVGRDARVTRTGHWLRATKLDELPQLFNVWLGEMSLVGPRPEVPYYVAKYSKEQRDVLEMRPGITDPASLKYRAESEVMADVENPEEHYIGVIMPDKIRINMAYARNSTIWSDIRVILKTVFGGEEIVEV